MVAGRPDAVPATSRAAVTSLEPSTEWPSGAPETRGQTAITAEIPAVPVSPAYGVLLPDRSIWYPGSKRKLPAPTFLRVMVWALAFLVAIGGACRLLGVLLGDPLSPQVIGALVMELGITPVLCLWQSRLSPQLIRRANTAPFLPQFDS